MEKSKINIFWFRRDLRLADNTGLFNALRADLPVLPIFIFDPNILEDLDNPADLRVQFIFRTLGNLNNQLIQNKKAIQIFHGTPLSVFQHLSDTYQIDTVFTNTDYEPYARRRDQQVKTFLERKGVSIRFFKDQIIFKTDDILKKDQSPYTIYTPYKNKWREFLNENLLEEKSSGQLLDKLLQAVPLNLTLTDIGFKQSAFSYPPLQPDIDIIANYDKTRNFPAVNGTSRMGIHLRFGTVSIRQLVKIAKQHNSVFLDELVWREFFMMILWHFPEVVHRSFKAKYDKIQWRNHKEDFDRWCAGKTGYPIVDAGMRELVSSGHMHNRVRMICASFLTKHFLIDWRWGETFFARYLLDFELSSNNGNWQWAAGCGCDAAPYFRIFNPETQQKKFDSELEYIRRWIPELNSAKYPEPIVEHRYARERALSTYKAALND